MTTIALALLVVLATIALALVFGGPRRPAPMSSISAPFARVDFSDLPEQSTFRAEDGQALAYRQYRTCTDTGSGSVLLVHGSSAASASMHPLAKAIAAAGFAVYALDMRGHGASGRRGHIERIGRLESDLEAFMREVCPPRPSTLVGFSAGAGFALRVAGSAGQKLFDRYLLLAPFIGNQAPTQRPRNGGWAEVGVPRILAIRLLNALGFRFANAMTVIRFALSDEAGASLTPQYDFNLASNFRPLSDYIGTIRRARQPCAVMAGLADEVFRSEQIEGIVREAGQNWPVTLLPNVGHMELTLEPSAIATVVRQLHDQW
ncbi:alpha/beta fold hydrolase [Burkholderia ubonensis]|uniref:alpha/beta fold hydrolase n=1 Tax=Burkholderia ubonensis TaxID=101571 RepID=UPI0007552F9F|nr:alpha/beta fold hydrolase [Burkholderia ubonensis]KVN40119.1 alpha/beta hydrolase [Burkholderia ubonensis]